MRGKQFWWAGLIGLAGVAAAAGPALASSFTGSGITFATQSVSVAGGNVTIGTAPPDFAGTPTSYTSNFFTGDGSTVTLTFSLPATATTIPGLTATGCFASPLTTSSAPTNTLVVTVTAVPACTGFGTLTLGRFTMSGATALGSPNTSNFKIKVAVSDPSIPAVNDNNATQLASSNSGLLIDTYSSNPPTQQIDTAAFGKQWIQLGADTLVADDGAVELIAPGGLVNASDTAAFSAPSLGSIVLTGQSWGGITNAVLLAPSPSQPGSATTSACGTTPSGTTGTVSGNTITFNNVPFPASGAPTESYYEVCLGVSGNDLIAANLLTVASVPSSTLPGVTLESPFDSASDLNKYTYNGGVQTILYSLGNVGAAYQAYFQFVNYGSSPVTINAAVQDDTAPGSGSGTGTGTVISSLAPNSSQLVTAQDVLKALGVTASATGRFSATFFAVGEAPCSPGANLAGFGVCQVGISQLLRDPASGIVVPLGSGMAP